ncbi:neuroligin-4, Y-linked-like [Actinia tenebrosa]|uniref:Carboxylic ester hydrolase n=1 Tax=Actinia tenebrosa TaxID=6105 RepID=A0A6P8H4V4_ACTTE|nr:neuroligin-4, Y-linked-like [Actinia tenebrosa]
MFLSLIVSSSVILLVNAFQYTPEVNIESGRIRGLVANLTTGHVVRKYLGIPFAKADRFKPPQNATKWSDVKNMITFGKECPQIPTRFSGINVSEDCLNLNVFVPEASSGSPLPVMVWVHGGGFLSGSNRIYDGSYISSLGNVIVVAINYRLTVFGFLTTGENGDLRGNYGMLDQVQALKWVKRNIAGFGGDPNKVTIFGESAGAASVSLLMLSPLTKGLFKNVIMQSGAATAKWAAISYDKVENITRDFGKKIGCTNLVEMEECLKTKSVNEMISHTTNNFSFLPVIDKHFLPDFPSVLLEKGQFEKYNLMVGVNNDEGTVMTNAITAIAYGMNVTDGIQRKLFEETVRGGDVLKFVVNQKPPLPAAMIYRYTDWSNVNDRYRNRRMFMDMIADAMFIAPAIQSAKAFVNHSLPTYFYQLQYRADNGIFGPIPSWVKAFHAADLSYVFGFPLMNASQLYTKDANFSREVIKIWTNFAKSGDPNNPESIPTPWPKYDLNNQQYVAFKPTMVIEDNLRSEYVAFWNNFVPEVERSMPKPCEKASDGNTITTTNMLLVISAIIASQLGSGYF